MMKAVSDKDVIIQKIISKENLQKLVGECEESLATRFSMLEIQSLVRYVRKMNTTTLKDQIISDDTYKKVNKYVANSYKNYINEPKAFDVKEMLKDQMENNKVKVDKYTMERFTERESMSNLGEMLEDENSLKQLTKILNRDSLLRDINILIDSRYQNLSNQDRSKFSFTIVSETKNKSEGSGTIIASTALQNIVEIEVFPFSIPYFNDADNYYKKITMSLLELSASSIDAYENSQFHFLFDIEKRLNLLYLTPINKIFRFHKPIAKINELTIRFGSPLAAITFEKDRLPTSNINYTSNPMIIEFYESHSLLSGDIIYINDFETLNNAQDLSIINDINTPKGHLCSRIDNTTISININANLIKFPDTGRQFMVYLGSKRLLIPFRIRYLDGK